VKPRGWVEIMSHSDELLALSAVELRRFSSPNYRI